MILLALAYPDQEMVRSSFWKFFALSSVLALAFQNCAFQVDLFRAAIDIPNAESSLDVNPPILPQALKFEFPPRALSSHPEVATTEVLADSSEPGNAKFLIPYIQTSRDLVVRAKCKGLTKSFRVVLRAKKENSNAVEITVPSQNSEDVVATFLNLEKGEYTIEGFVTDSEGVKLSAPALSSRMINVGIGDIIVAIGDSLTEGFYGDGYNVTKIENWTTAPNGSASTDNRNFPQWRPRGDRPEFPYFFKKSWMTDLNNRLRSRFGYPVFIVNAGWGGFQAGNYFDYMRTPGWSQRVKALKPNRWLIHLGVNDSVQPMKTDKSTFDSFMRLIVSELMGPHSALASQIYIAKPSYVVGADSVIVGLMRDYIDVIDALVAQKNLKNGPNFYSYYESDHSTYQDNIHPNAAGLSKVAELWDTVLTPN